GGQNLVFTMPHNAFGHIEITHNVFYTIAGVLEAYSADSLDMRNNVYVGGIDLMACYGSCPAATSVNNIFVGHNVWGIDGALSKIGSVSHSIWFNSPGFISGNGNMQADPAFLNANAAFGADGVPFTADDGFNIAASSPAINNGLVTPDSKDILGKPIVGTPDIGAYEFQ